MRDRAAEARRWRRQAENDLAFGELALRENFFAQACFVVQQTAEKALKSLAYAQGERLVVGHSIVELAERLARGRPLRGLRRAPGARGDRGSRAFVEVAMRRAGEAGPAGRV